MCSIVTKDGQTLGNEDSLNATNFNFLKKIKCVCMFVHVCTCACSHLHRWTWRDQRLNQMFSSFVLHHNFWDSISYWTWSLPVWLNSLAREPLEYSCPFFPSDCTHLLPYMGCGELKSDPHVHKVNTLLAERLPIWNVILKQECHISPMSPFVCLLIDTMHLSMPVS